MSATREILTIHQLILISVLSYDTHGHNRRLGCCRSFVITLHTCGTNYDGFCQTALQDVLSSYSLPCPPHNIPVASLYICKGIHKVSGNNMILSTLRCSKHSKQNIFSKEKKNPFFKGNSTCIFLDVLTKKIIHNS